MWLPFLRIWYLINSSQLSITAKRLRHRRLSVKVCLLPNFRISSLHNLIGFITGDETAIAEGACLFTSGSVRLFSTKECVWLSLHVSEYSLISRSINILYIYVTSRIYKSITHLVLTIQNRTTILSQVRMGYTAQRHCHIL